MPITYSRPEVFADLEKLVKTVCKSSHNKLIITGLPGSGKTYIVKQILKAHSPTGEIVHRKGYSTTKDMYRCFVHTKVSTELSGIVYDDCDSILNDKNSVNILKGLMDTDTSPVYYGAQGSTYDISEIIHNGVPDWDEYDDRYSKGRVPNEVTYNKLAIIISNKHMSEIDPALLSRCFHIDVSIRPSDMLDRIKQFYPVMESHVPINIREDVFNFMVANKNSYDVINMRTYIKAVNIAAVNNDWEDLVLNYV